MRFREQPLALRLYLLSCLPAASIVLLAVAAERASLDAGLLGVLLAATVVAGCCKLELDFFQARMSLAFAICCLACLLQGAHGALYCALTGAVVATYIRSPRCGAPLSLQRQPLHRLVFNLSLCTVCSGAGSLVYLRLLPLAPAGASGRLCALLVDAAIYFALNSAGLAVALGLQRGVRPFGLWKENLLWTAPGFFASAFIAWGAAAAWRALGVWTVVFLGPLALVYYSYGLYLQRLKEANTRLQREMEERAQAEAQRVQEQAARAEAEGARRQAEQEDQRKSVFLAVLGHELRNPLAAMRNALEVIRLRGNSEPALEGPLQILQRQVTQQTRLIDDLLDISRISHGKIQLRKERMELTSAVRQVAREMRPLVETRTLELTVTAPERPVWLDADPARLEQILSNLLTNAAKYNRPGGRIDVAVDVTPTPESAILSPGTAGRNPESLAPGTGAAIVRVRDTGVGITADMLPVIFDTFTQVDPTSLQAGGGLGLGLSLVRSLVALHGGEVEARSGGAGCGAEFIVRLPLARSREYPAPAPEGSDPCTAVRRLRILLADDNADAAVSLAEVLELWGHEVRVVHDGPAALETARCFVPEVALLDIGMPGLDGYAVARELRGSEAGRQMSLIALTGFGQQEDVKNAHAAGFDAHLTKPAQLEILRVALAGVEPPRSGRESPLRAAHAASTDLVA